MGKCLQFNPYEHKSLVTDKTGSAFGLALTLNIEQYEYTRGPNTDAGIKLYLHHQSDIPAVKDLGFAIGPGIHALVGIKLSNVSLQSEISFLY